MINKFIVYVHIFYTDVPFRMIPISPPKLLVSTSAVPTATASSEDDTLERNILSMASMDLSTAIISMNAIEHVCIYIQLPFNMQR